MDSLRQPNYTTRMKNFTDLRKISKVFHQYGIPLTGKKKYATFEKDLNMDKVFVNGRIFECELELRKELEEEKVHQIKAPAQVIELLVG